MYKITIPQRINQILAVFHLVRMWHHEDERVSLKMMWRLIYLLFYASFVISVALGGYLSDDKNKRIFSASMTIALTILAVKLIYILLNKEEILAFLHDIGVHFVTGRDELTKINEKLNKFKIFVSCLIFITIVEILFVIILFPLLSSEKVLPLNGAFPLDWKNSEIVYWMAYTHATIGAIISGTVAMLTILIWFIMVNCAIKYESLGKQFRSICSVSANRAKKIRKREEPNIFLNELIVLIKDYQHIKKTIDRFNACFSGLFFAQITTSGICICGGIYVLAFRSNEDLIQSGIYTVLLMYNIFDIFMVMHFGNEIKLWSDRCSYCLFEGDWYDQSISTKKCIIILSELLRKPQQLIVGKIYILDLETFISILKLAYSLFNILRNFN